MQDILSYINQFSSDSNWVVKVFIIVFVTLLANFFFLRLSHRLHIKLQRSNHDWDDALVLAARKPVAIAIWVLGLAWATEVAQTFADVTLLGIIYSFKDVILIGLFAWFLVRFIKQGESNLVGRTKDKDDPLDESTVHAVGKLLRLTIIITAGLVILQALGYSVSGVLAFGGIGGIAIGFAAKDLLANFFGGLMVYLDRPFSIGDWIRSPDQEIEGTVEYIGWRQTRIRTFDKRPLYVPNSTFTHISVENPSRMTHRRIYETIGVRYDDAAQLTKIIDAVEVMLQQHDEIDTSQTLMVNFNALAESSLDFFIYCFTKTTNWQRYHKVKQEVLVTVLNIIAEHGAEVAFPTSVIELVNDSTSLENKT